MIGRAFHVLQILSIDIVIGAVILLHFFSTYFNVSAPAELYIILGATVWLIYTIDHLRDAKKAPNSTRARYQFHLKHQRPLKVCSLIVLGGIISLLFFLDFKILIGGGVLAVFSAIYLLIHKQLARCGLKELYVALIYSSGILLTPFVLGSSVHLSVFVLLVLLTYSNLILFSWFEREEDIEDRFISLATVMELGILERLILVCLAAGISIAVLLSFGSLSGYFMFAFGIYGMLFIAAKDLKENQLYRVIGDGVFILPIIFQLL